MLMISRTKAIKHQLGFAVDPFALQDVDFELRILPSTNPANVFPAGATWELTVSRDGVVEINNPVRAYS